MQHPITYICSAALLFSLSAEAHLTVDCSKLSLSEVLELAQEGTTIQINGTCTDTAVVITTDGLTIIGGPDATLVGNGSNAVIAIHSAQRVTLTNLTIRGGSYGVVVYDGGSANLNQITTEQNGTGVGIVSLAQADIVDLTSRNNSNSGIFIARKSSAFFSGDTVSELNGGSGLFMRNGHATITGSLISSENGCCGAFLVNGSSLRIYSSASMAVTDNDGNGLNVHGSNFYVGGSLLSEGNENQGVWVRFNGSFVVQGRSRLAENGEYGLIVDDSSVAFLPDSQLMANFGGLLVRDGSTVELDGTLIEDNVLGLIASGNSRVGLYGSTIRNAAGIGLGIDGSSISIFNTEFDNAFAGFRLGSRIEEADNSFDGTGCDATSIPSGFNGGPSDLACPDQSKPARSTWAAISPRKLTSACDNPEDLTQM